MSFVHRQLLTALPRRSSRRTFISCPGNLKLLDSHSPSSPTTRTRTKSRRSSFVPQPHSKSEDPGPAATDDSEPAPVKLRHDDTEMDSASPRLTPWIKQLMDEIHTENGGSSSCSVAPSGIGNTFSLAGPNRTTATTTSMAIYDSFSVHNNPVSTTATTSDNDDDDDDDDERGNPLHNNKTISKLNEDPKICWPVDPNLYHHVRACLSDIEYEDPELATRDTGLSVCTLGTGAGNASKLRANTSTVIRAGSHSYLIDAGEGVQRQFLASRISFRDVRKIFITHMHGDHVFGLPSFLLNLQIAGLLANEQRTVEIYGPVGLFNYIATSLSLTGTELRKMTVEVYELHGGTQRSMRHQCNRRTFPEFFHQGLFRKVLPQNDDGTWTLAQPLEITTPDLAMQYSSKPIGMLIKAAEVHHIPQLQCFGYTLQEPWSQPRPINVNAAVALGVTSSISYRLLKAGFSVPSSDGKRTVHSEEVCGEMPLPRKVTVIGDCCMVPPAMEQLAMNSDVLVHEATLSVHDKGQKVTAGGHSTAAQAAIFANKVKAKVLMLNHLPKSVNTFKGAKQCVGEAASRIKGPTKVQLAYDHLEVLIPRKGFQFADEVSKPLWRPDPAYGLLDEEVV